MHIYLKYLHGKNWEIYVYHSLGFASRLWWQGPVSDGHPAKVEVLQWKNENLGAEKGTQ